MFKKVLVANRGEIAVRILCASRRGVGDWRLSPSRSEPGISGVVHFLDPYCYRCPFGWTKVTCKCQCISHVEEVIQHEGPDQIAAIFLEGVTGTNGLIIPPDITGFSLKSNRRWRDC